MSNKLYLWIGLSPLFISLIITVIILTLFKFLPPKLPLFYSLPWGEGQLATPQQFLVIPASISIIALLNLIISGQLHEQQYFFKKVLLLSGGAVAIILTITFIKIVLMFV
ncbi:MAG: hypothetical protein NUV73_00965 [Candidatus Daviesbacteria bacterium]|nr:hypothetical protein [Candidatus Daviesbacteria bacterium]